MMLVIEGLDGCGKATQTELLMKNLQKRNVEVQRITYPAYHSKSSTLVQMYLNGEIDKNAANINAYAASTFYAADRYIDFKREWQDAYLSDVTIVSDRYTTANQLYQATKQPADSRIAFADWVGDFEYNKLGLPKPDFVILLRIPVDISQELMLTRYDGDISKKDIHETDTTYLKHIYDVSTEIAEHYGWHIIDCYQNNQLLSRKEIADMILAKYDAFINSIKRKDDIMLITRCLNENDIPAAKKLVATEPDMYCIDFDVEDIDDSGFFIGLFKNDELIGICTIGSADCETEDIYNDEDCTLSNVYIKESERNQKYGQYMIENALKLANEQYGDVKCHISLLESSLSEWYNKMGFYQTVTDDFGICGMAYDLKKTKQLKKQKETD